MATIKRSGSRRATQSSPEASASQTSPIVSQYTRVAEWVASLNRGFDQVLHEIRTLRKLRVLEPGGSPGFFKTCRLMIEELRAWAFAEMTLDLHDCAGTAWNRWGIRRSRYEEQFRDPKDVLRAAERMKKRLADEAASGSSALLLNRPENRRDRS
jgi:hypothetical protein